MKEFKSFLERLGGLHDSVVDRLIWVPESQTLRLEIEDLCGNFKGLPEYPGVAPGVIVLNGVEKITYEIDSSERRLNIHEFHVEDEGAGKYRASLSFWPTGRITASYRAADFPEVNLRGQQGGY